MNTDSLNLFINRKDVYATQFPGGYSKKLEPITKEVLEKHLKTEITIGVYQLNKDNNVKWVCFDFDNEKNPHGELEKAKKLFEYLKSKGFNPLIDFSGKKGYHVWVFVNEIDGYSAQVWAKKICKAAKVKAHEIFPKQTELTKDKPYGNLVKVPLGKHQVSGNPCYLLDPETFEPLSQKEGLELLSKNTIDTIVKFNGKKPKKSPKKITDNKLPGCINHILNNGVDGGERNPSRFFISLYFLGEGLPETAILPILKDFNERCEPKDSEKSVEKDLEPVIKGFESGDYSFSCEGEKGGPDKLLKYCIGFDKCNFLKVGKTLDTPDTTEIKPELKELLEDVELWDKTLDEFRKKIVGERDTCETILLCGIGKNVKNPSSKTSFNLLVNSKSGAGKDYITNNVLKILPKDDYVKRTRITPAVLTYWHNSQFEPEWTWDGKVFYLEDISNGVLNSEVFKVMASEGSHATVVINQRAYDIEIVGKPVMIITTANSTPNSELVRRFTITNLNEKSNQTKEIMKRKCEFAKEGKSIDYDPEIINAIKQLKSVKVKVPFADLLYGLFSDKNIIMRTHIDRFIDFIKSSCVFHQYQRVNEEGYLLAENQDYEIARRVMLKISSNKYHIPLPHKERKIIEKLDELGGGPFNANQILDEISFYTLDGLRKALDRLVGKELLTRKTDETSDKARPPILYELVEFLEFDLPLFEEIPFCINDEEEET